MGDVRPCMPVTLATVLSHIGELANQTNAGLIQEFHEWMKDNQKSEAYQKNNVKAILNFAEWLANRDSSSTFYDVKTREVIIKYLTTKEKAKDIDPDQKWITTWNDYLDRCKVFYRWLFNYRTVDEKMRMPPSEWKTPDFIRIKHKKTQRASPYSATEIWELEELLSVVKYEPQLRNKAAIMLLWDLNARNHEVTNLRIKNVRLRENYAEGEIPEGKTGSGPILLTASFPYVRDWLNMHPLKHVSDARVICDLNTGKPLKSDRLWNLLMLLRDRIQTMVSDGLIQDENEKQRLRFLLQTKKWNPYCFRHSSITADSDYLPGYALNKKVRWTMKSRQPARYIKNRMGNELRRTILLHGGIEMGQDAKPKPTSRYCPKCNTVNALDSDYCSNKTCGYPLSFVAFEKIKEAEKTEMEQMLERKVQEILSRVDIKKLTGR